MTTLEIQSLSSDERLDLIARLWDSLEGVSTQLTEAQATELDNRRAHADADLATSRPWEQVRTALNARAR